MKKSETYFIRAMLCVIASNTAHSEFPCVLWASIAAFGMILAAIYAIKDK